MTDMRLIDANALINHVKGLPTWWADGGGYYPGTMLYPDGMFDPEDIVSSIENAPTINPESLRPVGRWEGNGMDVRCSECGESPISAMDVDCCYFWCFKPHYCPNCGARMKGENDAK